MLKKSTQELCWEAMEQLLAEKNYDKISVRDIAKRVGISTVTFYKYFASKADLFYWHVHTDGERYYKKLSEEYTWFNYIYDVLTANSKNQKEIWNIATNSSGYEGMTEIAYRCNTDLMKEYIERKCGEDTVTDELMMAVRVYLYGILTVLEKDIRNGMNTDRKKLAMYIANCMPEMLKQYIPQ